MAPGGTCSLLHHPQPVSFPASVACSGLYAWNYLPNVKTTLRPGRLSPERRLLAASCALPAWNRLELSGTPEPEIEDTAVRSGKLDKEGNGVSANRKEHASVIRRAAGSKEEGAEAQRKGGRVALNNTLAFMEMYQMFQE